jgi:hypothetical protein
MASWTFNCKWRSQECKLSLSKTSKVKELKTAIADKLGLDLASIKILLKGSSTHPDSTRLCDISGLSSPVSVTILAGTLSKVSVVDIDKKKYEEETQQIQKILAQASTRVGTTLPSSSIPHAAELFHPVPQVHDAPPRHVARPSGHVELQLPLFSGAMIPFGNPPSEYSNQVILPSNILQEFTQEEVPFPIVLEASRKDINGELRKTHLIPAEYHPRLTAVYAPYQILVDLGAFEKRVNEMEVDEQAAAPSASASTSSSASEPSVTSPFTMTGEGVLVTFKTVQLPPGTSATLQPLTFDWVQAVPEEQQKAVLETHLRRYLCLSLHDTITIQHQDRKFQFKVVALEPAEGVSLSSTDLAVDILTPIDAPLHSNLSSGLKSNAGSDSREIQQVLHLKKGDSRYFEMDLSDPNLSALLEVQSLEGFPPTILACTRHQYPSIHDHTWSSDDMSALSRKQMTHLQQTGRRRILLSQDDPNFRTGRVFIAVSAVLADVTASFRAVEGSKTDLALGFSAGLTSGSLLSSSGTEPPSGSSQCGHCLRWIPAAALTLHQLQCSRLNWRCSLCNFVCPIAEKDRHHSIAHATVRCECGFESEGDLVALHREFECHLRPFSCPYCNLSMPQNQRATHLSSCGARTSQCPHCQAWVKNYDLPAHIQDYHTDKPSENPADTPAD